MISSVKFCGIVTQGAVVSGVEEDDAGVDDDDDVEVAVDEDSLVV